MNLPGMKMLLQNSANFVLESAFKNWGDLKVLTPLGVILE